MQIEYNLKFNKMNYNIKKWYSYIFLILILGCAPNEFDFDVSQFIAKELKIEEVTGLRFNDNSVYDGAQFNIKSDIEGKYTVEILDLTNSLVSRNTLKVLEGNNVYTIYTRVLETGDYTFRFLDEKGNEKESIKLFVK